MKIIGRSQMVSHLSYKEGIRTLMNLGYEGVEISIFNKEFKLRDTFFDDSTQKEIKETMAHYKDGYFSVSAHNDYLYNDVMYESILKALPLAKKLGLDVFIISGTASRATSEEEKADEWAKNTQRIKAIVNVAASLALQIAIEFEPNFIVGTTNDLHRLFEEIDSEWLGANLDLGHVFLCDHDPMKAINSLKGKVFHTHIDDMLTGVHDHLIPGHGDMDIASYINALKKIGYDGVLGIDLYKYNYEEISEEAISYLNNLLNN